MTQAAKERFCKLNIIENQKDWVFLLHEIYGESNVHQHIYIHTCIPHYTCIKYKRMLQLNF